MIVDQSPEGLEVLRGASTYTYDGNWKVQAENGADGYHVSAVHWNYAATTSRRSSRRVGHRDEGDGRGPVGQAARRLLRLGERATSCSGTNGATPRTARCGAGARNGRSSSAQARADWMLKYSRNLCLYPNVYIMDQFGVADPAFPPIAVDKTEVTIYCIAPKGESDEARKRAHPPVRGLLQRQRHGHPRRPGGVPLLPEDLPGRRAPWNDMSRGAEHWIDGPDDDAKELGLEPGVERGPHRGRGPVPRPARLLEEGTAQGRRSRGHRSR